MGTRVNAPEIDALNDGNFELDEEATQDLMLLWGDMVHGEWLWYNDDNTDTDTIADVDGSPGNENFECLGV